MIKDTDYETKFWDILERGKLVNLSQFHKPNVFDEVPLFTRYSDLKFLEGVEKDRANAILLGFALKYLKSVVSYEEHRTTYLAAITVWAPEDDDSIVPNLFVWSGTAQRAKRLRKELILDGVKTPFGKKIKRMVPKGTSHPRFDVLEDRSTLPGECRVFVSLTHAPYRNFLPIEGLHRPKVVV